MTYDGWTIDKVEWFGVIFLICINYQKVQMYSVRHCKYCVKF